MIGFALLTALLSVLLNACALAAWLWWTRPVPLVPATPDAFDKQIDEAIRVGMQKAGVALEPRTDDRELGHKWHEVLFHATRAMGYTTRTVADLREWLDDRPRTASR